MDKEPSLRKWEASSWEAALTVQGISMALGSGMLLNPAILEAMNEAQDQLEQIREGKRDDNDKNKRPPRPPRRPNARVPRVSFGLS